MSSTSAGRGLTVGSVASTNIRNELIVEGLDPAYSVESWKGVDGGEVRFYSLEDVSEAPAEHEFVHVELPTKDFGKYETVDPGAQPFLAQAYGRRPGPGSHWQAAEWKSGTAPGTAQRSTGAKSCQGDFDEQALDYFVRVS